MADYRNRNLPEALRDKLDVGHELVDPIDTYSWINKIGYISELLASVPSGDTTVVAELNKAIVALSVAHGQYAVGVAKRRVAYNVLRDKLVDEYNASVAADEQVS